VSPLATFESPAMNSKATAKRAAAFEACIQLRKGGHLNEYLLPKFRLKDRPKYANARLAVDINKTNTYTYRRKPGFWDIVDNIPPTELWLVVFSFKNRENLATQPVIHPICIASRNRLPALPSFPVFPTNGGTSDVVIHRVDKPLAVSEESLLLLSQYTDRVFYDVFNKHFEMSHLRYWFVPVKESENYCPSELVDWDALRYTSSAREFVWGSDTPTETFVGKFLIDRVDRSRRFASHGLAPELKARHPVPHAVAKAQQFKDIQDYSYNAGKKRKWQQIKWDIPSDEPVFLADRLLHRLNYLDLPHARDTGSVTTAVICPSPFSASLV
jgi:endoribonuclease Dicer